MDNYKIKVKDEAESKEAQELFEQLGYKFTSMHRNRYTNMQVFSDGSGSKYETDDAFCQELTLPQLRDLVVLKRNDVKDSNCTYRLAAEEKNYAGYLDSNDWMHIFKDGGWQAYVPIVSEELKAFYLNSNVKDPALISGAEAWIAIANGRLVQWVSKDFFFWQELDITNLNAKNFLDEERVKESGFKYRLKPTTLTVNAELPKPSNVTLHNQNYSVTYEFKTREERNAFADKLRGANS